jgi:hypothetical protein
MFKPSVYMLHNLARSGGTVIGKCLGCMPEVFLLSEIHQDVMTMYPNDTHPITQALNWGLITLQELEGKRLTIIDAVQLIEEKCTSHNKKLVIRDFAYLDFIGMPIVKPPSFKLMLAEILSHNFEVIQFAIVRHPVDQWLSMINSTPIFLKVSLDVYLRGYLEFGKQIQSFGFIRYEDFVKEPEKQMQHLCYKLRLRFDRTFVARWSSYNKITGDLDHKKSRAAGSQSIAQLPRRPMDEELKKQFRNNSHYREAIKLLGYGDIE